MIKSSHLFFILLIFLGILANGTNSTQANSTIQLVNRQDMCQVCQASCDCNGKVKASGPSQTVKPLFSDCPFCVKVCLNCSTGCSLTKTVNVTKLLGKTTLTSTVYRSIVKFTPLTVSKTCTLSSMVTFVKSLNLVSTKTIGLTSTATIFVDKIGQLIDLDKTNVVEATVTIIKTLETFITSTTTSLLILPTTICPGDSGVKKRGLTTCSPVTVTKWITKPWQIMTTTTKIVSGRSTSTKCIKSVKVVKNVTQVITNRLVKSVTGWNTKTLTLDRIGNVTRLNDKTITLSKTIDEIYWVTKTIGEIVTNVVMSSVLYCSSTTGKSNVRTGYSPTTSSTSHLASSSFKSSVESPLNVIIPTTSTTPSLVLSSFSPVVTISSVVISTTLLSSEITSRASFQSSSLSTSTTSSSSTSKTMITSETSSTSSKTTSSSSETSSSSSTTSQSTSESTTSSTSSQTTSSSTTSLSSSSSSTTSCTTSTSFTTSSTTTSLQYCTEKCAPTGQAFEKSWWTWFGLTNFDRYNVTGMYGPEWHFHAAVMIGGDSAHRLHTFNHNRTVNCQKLNPYFPTDWTQYGAVLLGYPLEAIQNLALLDLQDMGYPGAIWSGWGYAPEHDAKFLDGSSGTWEFLNGQWASMHGCGLTWAIPSNPSPLEMRWKWLDMNTYLSKLPQYSAFEAWQNNLLYWRAGNWFTNFEVVTPRRESLDVIFRNNVSTGFVNIPSDVATVINVALDDCSMNVTNQWFRASSFPHGMCNVIWNVYPTDIALKKCQKEDFKIFMYDGSWTGFLLAPLYHVYQIPTRRPLDIPWFTGKAVIREFTGDSSVIRPFGGDKTFDFLDFNQMGCPGYTGCVVDCQR